jgi:threonine/homoserine/homoserine lactone efflux protein
MPPLELLIPFALATLTFAVMPGPALLYTAAQTLARGRSGGLLAALGIHLGCYAHVLAATLGLSAIFETVPVLYAILKVAGALYLIWIGVGIIRGRTRADALPQMKGKGARRAFVESILVELLNPKVALFFIAFLPQFVDPAASLPVWTQFLILGVVVNLSFTTADLVTVLVASAVVAGLRRSGRMDRWLRAAGGSILVGLGVQMAASRQ